jgi:magnesium transporter
MKKRGNSKAARAKAAEEFVSKGKNLDNVKITVFDYDEAKVAEKEVHTVEGCFPFRGTPQTTWVNIEGLHDSEAIRHLGKHYDMHPLIIEDILNTEQRPKIDFLDTYILVVLKMLYFDQGTRKIKSEHVSLVLGKNYVISFQETGGDVFDKIRERIRTDKGRIRKMGADFLAYSLMDAILDNYFIILEQIGDNIEKIEDELVSHAKQGTLKEIYTFKRETLMLRKSVWPLREVASQLQKSESDIIKEKTEIYFNDLYDNTIQIIDTIEIYRDMIAGMLELYLSSVSNRLNEIMKVLTIIATIFIPLTFITGVYGMNFRHMPELEWEWGYYAIWLVIILMGSVMLMYFRKRDWL